MKVCLGFVFLLIQSISLFSQESLQGYVVQEDSKGKLIPMPFVNVYWEGSNYGTSTDSLGYFRIAVPEKERTLVASFVGFEPTKMEVKEFDEAISLLLKHAVNLEAVEIQARQKSTQMSFINPLKTELITERELFKAACCNLSESFETNPSVDVNFTDAITGTKQIQMLGLDGPYTMISRENMPGIRGLGNAFGLSFIPGSWISSIQVTKGTGSVVNGYESIAGQINTELKKPEEGKQTFVNLYGNQSGRTEINLVQSIQVSEDWGTTLLLHGNTRPLQQDQNRDGFLDFPEQDQINVMNRWKYDNCKGLMGQIGIHFVQDDKRGGQSDDEIQKGEKINSNFNPYRVKINTERVEVFGKMGYVFAGSKYKSMGLQASLLRHRQNSLYGLNAYRAIEESLYINYIFQSILWNSFHQFKTGASYFQDDMQEKLNGITYNRLEQVPGAFFEYSYEPNNNFTLVAGIRGDYHNLYEPFLSPRLHVRWASSETAVFRVLGGSGQKTANPIAEHQSVLVSSRALSILGNRPDLPYGLKAERAWNMGFNFTKEFRLDYRDGYISLDVYRTQFTDQVIYDRDQASDQVLFYNLEGESISNSVQVELSYEVLKFLDLRVAYRFTEVKIDYLDKQRSKPFVPLHRMFSNLSYESAKNLDGANWAFDLTGQWVGEQRVPSTANNDLENIRSNQSPSFMLFNTQVTRNVNNRWAFYVGVENVFDYVQNNPIVDADNPFGSQFDASMVWGPIFGRMAYGGLRFKLQEEKD